MKQSTVSSPIDERCHTGVEGLDEILAEGLPCNCFYLIQGDPGSGKTTLALQFLLEGVRRGEKALYITLSETKEELYKVAHSHGWSLDGIALFELSAIETLVRPDAHTTVFHPSEIELTKVTDQLLTEIRNTRPSRIVFDSLSEFRLWAETALRYRRQLLNLKQELAKYQSTVLLLDDKMDNRNIAGDPHVLSLTHGVIEMEQLSPDYGRSRRRLRVLKLRGVRFREGFHDYTIEKGGLRVFPRIVAAEHRLEFRREPVESGYKDLDDLLGGGLDRGTTTLIMGQAGTGKSTLALQYAVQMASRGERSILFAFDEVRGLVLARAASLGLRLAPHVETGVISVQQVDPAELSPGEFAMQIRRAVEEGCKLVVIDSLNGYMNAMPGERYLANQLHELSAYLNQQGVVTIFILALHGLVSQAEAPIDLSYLADTVVNVRFFEAAGAVRQALSVIKKRSGRHEKTIREFQLESGTGLRVGKPLAEFQGVLSGAPVFHGGSEQMMRQPNGGG
ncbi:MAG TPA: ATPase domain-containing protein [Nitrospira sp.]|nr:ATPase domain-containing protein [Nitrospira sp.]